MLRPRNPVSQSSLRVREEGEQKAVGDTGKKAGYLVSDSGGRERTREQRKVGCRHLDKAEEIMFSPKKAGNQKILTVVFCLYLWLKQTIRGKKKTTKLSKQKKILTL